mgnify:CR=1 FL=1
MFGTINSLNSGLNVSGTIFTDNDGQDDIRTSSSINQSMMGTGWARAAGTESSGSNHVINSLLTSIYAYGIETDASTDDAIYTRPGFLESVSVKGGSSFSKFEGSAIQIEGFSLPISGNIEGENSISSDPTLDNVDY